MNNGQNPPHSSNGGFEAPGPGRKTIFGFLIGLALLGVLVYFVVTGMYRTLNGYYAARQPAPTPLKQPAVGDTRDLRAPRVKERIENSFPQPLLETDERNELNDFRTQEEDQLNSYGWGGSESGNRCTSRLSGPCS